MHSRSHAKNLFTGPAAMFIFLVALLLVGPSTASAALFVVTNTGDTGSGTLRQAIADAADGDVIAFLLSGCPCVITLSSGSLQTSKNLTIVGPGAGVLRLDGNGGVGIDPLRRSILENGGT